MRISPLNLSALVARMKDAPSTEYPPDQRPRAIEITVYLCRICRNRYDDEDEAIDCCSDMHEVGAVVSGSATCCPVCESKYLTHEGAADCCLWKDPPAPDRWRVASAVNAGSTWAEALQLTGPRLAS